MYQDNKGAMYTGMETLLLCAYHLKNSMRDSRIKGYIRFGNVIRKLVLPKSIKKVMNDSYMTD